MNAWWLAPINNYHWSLYGRCISSVDTHPPKKYIFFIFSISLNEYCNFKRSFNKILCTFLCTALTLRWSKYCVDCKIQESIQWILEHRNKSHSPFLSYLDNTLNWLIVEKWAYERISKCVEDIGSITEHAGGLCAVTVWHLEFESWPAPFARLSRAARHQPCDSNQTPLQSGKRLSSRSEIRFHAQFISVIFCC